ncbi:MAG: hypothetical protein ACJASL_003043 [Paraglaciecola sp.]|jgi:hypothetical protein
MNIMKRALTDIETAKYRNEPFFFEAIENGG